MKRKQSKEMAMITVMTVSKTNYNDNNVAEEVQAYVIL